MLALDNFIWWVKKKRLKNAARQQMDKQKCFQIANTIAVIEKSNSSVPFDLISLKMILTPNNLPPLNAAFLVYLIDFNTQFFKQSTWNG